MHLCGLSVICLLLSSTERKIVQADWVEIPQFSDSDKIYRPPINLQEYRQYKFPAQRRVGFSTNHHSLVNATRITKIHNPVLKNTSPVRIPPVSVGVFASVVSTTSTTTSTELPFTQNPDDEDLEFDSNEFEDISVVETDTEDYLTTTTSEPRTSTTKYPKYENRTNKKPSSGPGGGFLDYIPIDLLKRVHRTLKSQPTSIAGKINFLKSFRKGLLKEIERRLNAALAPPRKTRMARTQWEEDESVGFPSLEGALMAISFLTFAVYLVKLVIHLFRSIKAAQLSTTVPPAVFLGRKKRSIVQPDDLNEDTVRILGYLDSYGSHQFHH